MSQITRRLLFLFACSALADGSAFAQGLDLRIEVTGSVARATGGETASGRPVLSLGPLVFGRETAGVYAPDPCGAELSLAERRGPPVAALATPKPFGEWRVSVLTQDFNPSTGQVRFRLSWSPVPDAGKPLSDDRQGTRNLSLRPGESYPIEILPVTAVAAKGLACGPATIRVSVDYWPRPQDDRRLVSVDLWLIETLADGTERSQAQTVRGLFNQPIPYYFDSLVNGADVLDVSGNLVVRSTFAEASRGPAVVSGASGDRFLPLAGSSMDPNSTSRLTVSARASKSGVPAAGFRGFALVGATVQFKQEEVLSVRLPRDSRVDFEMGSIDIGPNGNVGPNLSLRIRVRQIR